MCSVERILHTHSASVQIQNTAIAMVNPKCQLHHTIEAWYLLLASFLNSLWLLIPSELEDPLQSGWASSNLLWPQWGNKNWVRKFSPAFLQILEHSSFIDFWLSLNHLFWSVKQASFGSQSSQPIWSCGPLDTVCNNAPSLGSPASWLQNLSVFIIIWNNSSKITHQSSTGQVVSLPTPISVSFIYQYLYSQLNIFVSLEIPNNYIFLSQNLKDWQNLSFRIRYNKKIEMNSRGKNSFFNKWHGKNWICMWRVWENKKTFLHLVQKSTLIKSNHIYNWGPSIC